MTTVKVHFSIIEYLPDNQQYKQQSTKTVPMLDGEFPEVELDLPVELLANSEAYLLAGVEGNKLPKPYLTPKAWRWITDQFKKELSDVSLDDFKPNPELNNAGDWDVVGNDLEVIRTNSEKATEQLNDGWDEAEKPTTTDEPWDETTEDWGEPT
jgi:hypothetical protein